MHRERSVDGKLAHLNAASGRMKSRKRSCSQTATVGREPSPFVAQVFEMSSVKPSSAAMPAWLHLVTVLPR